MGYSQRRSQELELRMNIERLGVNFGGKPSGGYGGSFAISPPVHGIIPHDYISFVRATDGGHPRVGSFKLPGLDERNFFDVDVFYSWEDTRGRSINEAIARWSKILGDNALPIGQDGGGNQIYIDLMNEGESVWICLHDEGCAKIKVANSFGTFISMLCENPDFI